MNPIPPFRSNHLLPPYMGDVSDNADLSPFKCNIFDFCERFATSKDRIQILKGLITFRKRMTEEKILKGFQWLYGSFTENIEVLENRSPTDLDLVTFFYELSQEKIESFKNSFPEFISLKKSKRLYKLDHVGFNIGITPEHTVEITGAFLQVFAHTRSDIWKGILRIEINTVNEDERALEYLNNLELHEENELGVS